MAFGPNPPPIQAHICVKDGLEAIAFYEKAFGAKCPFHQLAEDGKRVMHANIELFGSEVLSPSSRGGASMAINVNLPKPTDVDAAVDRARSAGAEVVMSAQDTFWGARYGRVRDPFGHVWAFNAPLKENAA